MSDELFNTYKTKYAGSASWSPNDIFMEVLYGTVPSGDSFPTTHGNTMGLIMLWDYIFFTELGVSLIDHELAAKQGKDYTLPIRICFCGDDAKFYSVNFFLEYLR